MDCIQTLHRLQLETYHLHKRVLITRMSQQDITSHHWSILNTTSLWTTPRQNCIANMNCVSTCFFFLPFCPLFFRLPSKGFFGKIQLMYSRKWLSIVFVGDFDHISWLIDYCYFFIWGKITMFFISIMAYLLVELCAHQVMI